MRYTLSDFDTGTGPSAIWDIIRDGSCLGKNLQCNMLES